MALPVDWLAAWLCAASLAAVVTAVWDKSRARRHRWRVPERTLWLLAALGGAAAMFLTFRLIRHKTLHRRFMWGLPLLVAAQAALLYVFWHQQWVIFT